MKKAVEMKTVCRLLQTQRSLGSIRSPVQPRRLALLVSHIPAKPLQPLLCANSAVTRE